MYQVLIRFGLVGLLLMAFSVAFAATKPGAASAVGAPAQRLYALFGSPQAQGTHRGDASLDDELRTLLLAHNVSPIEVPPMPAPEKVELGRMLFFDKILSGNKDISCAGCHLMTERTGDGLPLSIGTGGKGTAPNRRLEKAKTFIPRHAPDIFNRGVDGWTTMLWDSRIAGTPETGIYIPESPAPIDGLDSVLAAQVMSTVLNRGEMRGHMGDKDAVGESNELALNPDGQPEKVWDDLMDRLLAIPEYERMFRRAYPGTHPDEMTFQYAANAVAAFETAEFTMLDTPWDRYLAGDDRALSDAAKEGALLFYDDAGCASCHAGNLFTDQQTHNLAVPPIAVQAADLSPVDLGRAAITGAEVDRYAFRTPPLRNVALTAPYMHNGAYATLEAAIRHHLDPAAALRSYRKSQLRAELASKVRTDAQTAEALLATLDRRVAEPLPLSDKEVGALVAFLHALSDPRAVKETSMAAIEPATVPSNIQLSYE
ncbi:MAG TPA: cytochrome c peroxidase [bacterium]|nr:cytochrome c peroxidase [bacterium]